MKTTRLPLLLAGFLSLASLLHAQTITSGVPGLISYQGRVLDSTGAPVGDTTTGTPVNRTVTFRVWNHASNTGSTNLIYSEQQVVTIADGNFSVLVGQGVATAGSQFPFSENDYGPGASPPVSIANAFGGSERYLGVTVDDANGATVDSEIAPRQQVVSSAFALRSKVAESLTTGSSGSRCAKAAIIRNERFALVSPGRALRGRGCLRLWGSGSTDPVAVARSAFYAGFFNPTPSCVSTSKMCRSSVR